VLRIVLTQLQLKDFVSLVRRLLSLGMPPREQRKTYMFSATFPREIQELAATFLRPGYTWISIGQVGSTTASITQQLVQCSSDKSSKMELLAQKLVEVEGRTLVFVRMKRTAHQVKRLLQRDHNIAAAEIHGDRSQQQREAALDAFRSGQTRVLIVRELLITA
jgi:ATP-dependent RNA helicase DDX3X